MSFGSKFDSDTGGGLVVVFLFVVLAGGGILAWLGGTPESWPYLLGGYGVYTFGRLGSRALRLQENKVRLERRLRLRASERGVDEE